MSYKDFKIYEWDVHQIFITLPSQLKISSFDKLLNPDQKIEKLGSLEGKSPKGFFESLKS